MPQECSQLFSEKSLNPLSKLRVEIKDDLAGAFIKETQNLAVKRIKAVMRGTLNERAEGRQITAAAIKATIEKKYGPKPPKRLHELMKIEQRRANRFLASLEAATELEGGEFFSDAEEDSPGCAKRLATAYSKAASFLRNV